MEKKDFYKVIGGFVVIIVLAVAIQVYNQTPSDQIIGQVEPEIIPKAISKEIPEEEISSLPQTKEFNVIIKEFDFIPDTITVNEGDRVILYITSENGEHGFLLSEFSVNKRIYPGKITTVEFIADKKGVFGFRCNFECGYGHSGLRGTFIVN
jgi:heme/copper-type cytochrome/quinol oxidase subunit 2